MEEAERVLGTTRAKAQKETVLTLRERLKQHANQRQNSIKPLARLPVGLGKMTKEKLQEEVQEAQSAHHNLWPPTGLGHRCCRRWDCEMLTCLPCRRWPSHSYGRPLVRSGRHHRCLS